MALKSYSFTKKVKPKSNKPVRSLVTGGITALLGLSLLGVTANAVSNI